MGTIMNTMEKLDHDGDRETREHEHVERLGNHDELYQDLVQCTQTIGVGH